MSRKYIKSCLGEMPHGFSEYLCPGDGIGSHARLKIACRKAWGFDSPPGHIMDSTYLYKKKLAYIVGVAIGDGNLSNPNGRAVRLRVTCDKKYPELIIEISKHLQYLFPKNMVSLVDRKGCMDISVYSNKLEDLLGWKAKGGSKAKQNVTIPSWILKSKTYTKECLRGLLQSDGSIYNDRGYTMINFTTIIPDLADQVHKLILDLGYKNQLRKAITPKSLKYVIRISKETDLFIKEIKLWKK